MQFMTFLFRKTDDQACRELRSSNWCEKYRLPAVTSVKLRIKKMNTKRFILDPLKIQANYHHSCTGMPRAEKSAILSRRKYCGRATFHSPRREQFVDSAASHCK